MTYREWLIANEWNVDVFDLYDQYGYEIADEESVMDAPVIDARHDAGLYSVTVAI